MEQYCKHGSLLADQVCQDCADDAYDDAADRCELLNKLLSKALQHIPRATKEQEVLVTEIVKALIR